MRFSTGRAASAVVVFFFLSASSILADIWESYSVYVDVLDDVDTAGEMAARIDICSVADFNTLTYETQVDCLKYLIYAPKTCADAEPATGTGDLICDVNGALLNTSTLHIACSGDCPFANTTLTLPDASDCAPRAVPGFSSDQADDKCYKSAYCRAKETNVTSFGAFCPSATGEYCCSDTVNLDTGYSGANSLAGSVSATAANYIANLDFKIKYEVKAPAMLKIQVEVPYVQSTTTHNVTFNGETKVYKMCPTTYLIDFVDPISTEPFSSVNLPWGRSSWTQLA